MHQPFHSIIVNITQTPSMPPKKLKGILPPIAWDADDHALVWKLIAEVTKPANLKVLCRKSTKQEVSDLLKDGKTIYHIGNSFRTLQVRPRQAYSDGLAQSYCLSCTSLMLLPLGIELRADMKGRSEPWPFSVTKLFSRLAKVYKQHAKRLTITGEGIDPDSEDGADSQTCSYFIEAGGPDENTPEQAKNIWGKYF